MRPFYPALFSAIMPNMWIWLLTKIKLFRIYYHSVSIIDPGLHEYFKILQKISILNTLYWLTKKRGRWGGCWDEKYAWRRVEKYVFICLCIESLFIYLVGLSPFNPQWLLYLLVVFMILLLLWRLSDIIAQWFNNYIFGSGKLLSAPRFLILTLINYLEITIIFGILAFVFKSGFQNTSLFNLQPAFWSPWQSLRYSIGIVTTMGSVYEPSKWYGYLIFIGEITFTILFLVAIVNIALSFFPLR